MSSKFVQSANLSRNDSFQSRHMFNICFTADVFEKKTFFSMINLRGLSAEHKEIA